MRFLTNYYHAFPEDDPEVLPVAGDYPSAADALDAAVIVADTVSFREWCVAIEIKDEHGNVVAMWSLDANRN
jgi:hypothetical protein